MGETYTLPYKMKRFIAIALFLLPVISFAQIQQKTKLDERFAKGADNLKYVFDVPVCGKDTVMADATAKFKYNNGCGDHLFWQVVEYRIQEVPYLLNIIDSEEDTQAKLPDGKGNYRVGDVALMALQEIIHGFPVEEFSEVKKSDYKEVWKFYHKGLKDKKKRAKLKEALALWFAENQKNLEYIKSDEFGNCTCTGKHPVGGFYQIKAKRG